MGPEHSNWDKYLGPRDPVPVIWDLRCGTSNIVLDVGLKMGLVSGTKSHLLGLICSVTIAGLYAGCLGGADPIFSGRKLGHCPCPT